MKKNKISIIIPCFNEEISIGKVVSEFKNSIKGCDVYVYDNNSTDSTSEVALKNGAIVRKESLQGKGFVVRRMFSDIDSDIYILVDGDNTYDPKSAPEMVRILLESGADMVTGVRMSKDINSYRAGHKLGNKVLTSLVSFIFGDRCSDMLSGYRVFSHRFVKSFPSVSQGFEIETELTVHALDMHMNIQEIETSYISRDENSFSKLSTFRDGFRILRTILSLLKLEKPLLLFSCISLILLLVSLLIFVPLVLLPWLETGFITRIPTAILSTGLVIVAVSFFSIGIILESTTRARMEVKRLSYNRYKPPLCDKQ
jgi:glycosyltransferase involved in cell wall biosynthesis